LTRRPRPAPQAAQAARKPAPGVPALEVLRAAAHAAVGKKARTPVALDLREFHGVCDYFFICSGSSEVQVKAIAEAVEENLRERGVRAWHIEGFESRRWVLLDYVEVVVHVFHEKTREYYMLDRLWGDARSLDLGLERAD
jgi:ribosome-associated protein